jgi:ABC-2 type transport system permease protein
VSDGGTRVARQTGAAASARRVLALIRRHAYLLLKSWPRMLSMAYYPTVTMVLWGFVTIYLAPSNDMLRDAPGLFIGAVLLWDILFRGQLGVSLTFIEEIYSRNLGNLLVTPLTLPEFIAGQLAMSVLRTAIGVGGACLFAWFLFHYSIFSLGFALIAFFANLLAFGWAIGLVVSAMIMRAGLGAEELAWAAIFLVAPVSGVYYPIDVLPQWLQAVALALPSAHVFEGMRAVLLAGTFPWDRFWAAVALNALYLALGAAIFAASVRAARMRGTLLQMGEWARRASPQGERRPAGRVAARSSTADAKTWELGQRYKEAVE